MVDNEIKMMRQENLRLGHEREQMADKIADNTTKIKQNKVLPYLVSKVVEVSPPSSLTSTHRPRSLTPTHCSSFINLRLDVGLMVAIDSRCG